MIERVTEETGIESGRKKMKEAGEKIETMTRKRVMTERDLENGQKTGKVRVKQKRKNTKMTKMTRSTGMIREIPKKTENIAEVEAGRGSIGVGVEVRIQVSIVEVGAKRN